KSGARQPGGAELRPLGVVMVARDVYDLYKDRGRGGENPRSPSRRLIRCVLPSGSESSPARRRGKTCSVVGRLGQEHPHEGGHQWPPPIRPRHRSWTLAKRAFLPASRPRPV